MAARQPSKQLWFAHRFLSAVGLVKRVEWRALGHFPDGPRFRHAVAVIGNALYILGGKHYYGARDTLASVYRYRPMEDSWERLASMACGRSYFAAAGLGGFIYALGGSSDQLYCTDSVERYDLATDTWRRCQPLPVALCGHAACALDGALYKYYPPDFDPAKIPKLKLPKDRQYVVRLMAPFNMRCKTCGEYIYKGKKFNARKETVQNEVYLGLPIFRFYIKCTRCLAEITFKTDPENTDYTMEHGATRNFQAEKLLEEEEKRMQKEREDEELNNPMKVLENRTKDSKLEMEVLENLQELKELNQRQANVDFEAMLKQYKEYEEEQKRKEQEEDEQEMKAMLEQAQSRRLLLDADAAQEPVTVHAKTKPTVILQEEPQPQAKKPKTESWERSVGGLSSKAQLAGLVTVKKPKPGATVANGTGTQGATASTGSCPPAPGATSSLGLLGTYSDSEDSASADTGRLQSRCRRAGTRPSPAGDTALPGPGTTWYHGAIGRAGAETLLALCREGSFLVRDCETSPEDYSLSLRSSQGFVHVKLTRTRDRLFVLGRAGAAFPSVPAAVRHYSARALPVRGARHLSLLYPVAAQTL
ncbi:PREDICTED: coiled-coil domain-containing protein 94 [Tinamus guttatus]|nr:PREDICTED: coiled-coil domain-containing protein 94 [Tinamus guttatus]